MESPNVDGLWAALFVILHLVAIDFYMDLLGQRLSPQIDIIADEKILSYAH